MCCLVSFYLSFLYMWSLWPDFSQKVLYTYYFVQSVDPRFPVHTDFCLYLFLYEYEYFILHQKHKRRYVLLSQRFHSLFHNFPFQECCICLTSYENGAELNALPCNHHFHSTCIVKWLKMNATCPLCKYNILKGNEQV